MFSGAAHTRWKFLRVANWMDDQGASPASATFVEELECGSNLFFRPVRLSWLGRAWKKLRRRCVTAHAA
jgi:hypothetical protein